jgi:hypothetical protein
MTSGPGIIGTKDQGDPLQEDGSRGMNNSSSPPGTGGWYTWGRPTTLAQDGTMSGGTNGNCPSQVDGGEGNTRDSLGGGIL